MERMRGWALRLIVLLNVLATIVAFGESFYGLFRWADGHQITGFGAGIWPLMFDTMILVGELALFVAHVDGWTWKGKAWAWTTTFTALAASVAANVGHVHTTDWLTRLTFAAPPVLLMFTVTVGFGVMKRTYGAKNENREPLLTETFSRVSQPLTEMVPVRTERVSVENDERPGEKTMFDLPVIPKDAKIPPDPRRGLNTEEIRVRDMIDADPSISVNRVKEAEGISWAKANRMMKESREARGIA